MIQILFNEPNAIYIANIGLVFNNKFISMNYRSRNPAARDYSYGAPPVFCNLKVIVARSSRFAVYRKQGFSIRPRFSYAKSVESELAAIVRQTALKKEERSKSNG